MKAALRQAGPIQRLMESLRDRSAIERRAYRCREDKARLVPMRAGVWDALIASSRPGTVIG